MLTTESTRKGLIVDGWEPPTTYTNGAVFRVFDEEAGDWQNLILFRSGTTRFAFHECNYLGTEIKSNRYVDGVDAGLIVLHSHIETMLDGYQFEFVGYRVEPKC